MSNPDSFIDEVTEAVRRDRLFVWLRRYGWIAVLAVLLIVGGASWREWQLSQQRQAAEALGDSILAALDEPDASARAEALGALTVSDDARAVVGLLSAGETAEGADAERRAETLRAIAGDATLPVYYTQLAALKLVMLDGREADPESRLQTLAPLAEPGQPYRTLALEQMALAEIDAGQTDKALSRLQGLLQDADASAGLRQRAGQLIVALGGTPQQG